MEDNTRWRKIKKLGNSYAIHLVSKDLKHFGIKLGDMVDISDCVVMSENLYKLKFEEEEE
jgi:antitoxin component of MazEF toxin-antitoxin module